MGEVKIEKEEKLSNRRRFLLKVLIMKLTRILLRRYKFRNVHEPAPELSSGIAKNSKDYANLPERFLVRKTAKIAHKSEDHPAYVPRLNKWKAQYHGLERPWTDHYWKDAGAFKEKHPDIVQPICEEDWMWFRGDIVEILTGDDKEIQGESPGALLREPQPLLVTSEIKLVDPHDNNSCDVIWSYTEDGTGEFQRVRVSTRTGRILPIPSKAMETIDYKSADTYLENKDKDTPKDLVEEVTFQPKLATFEMDIMEKMNIKEDRVPKKTFWY